MASNVSHRPAPLRAVDPLPPTPLGPVALELSLSSSPFRPGELPTTSLLTLDAATRDRIVIGGGTSAVPAELWLRLAVESARLMGEIEARCRCTRLWIVDALDTTASDAPTADSGCSPSRVDTIHAGALARYADLLETPHPTGRVLPRMPIRLPEEMASGWRRAAADAGQTLQGWIAARVFEAPARPVKWEIAAARACQTLAEWAYAACLREFANTIASPIVR